MVDASWSVVNNTRRPVPLSDERNVLDIALDADDNEILKVKASEGTELSNVQITVGGGSSQLGSTLGMLLGGADEGTEETEKDEDGVDENVKKEKKPPQQLTEDQKLRLAKKQEEERKAMRERKRKELEQKFLRERFAEKKKLNAAKRGMDPRAFEEVRKKIHKLQTDRMMDDSDGKFELSDQELDAAIAEEQRMKQQQSAAMKRQVGQLMGMTQKLMSGIPKSKQQQMSQMMNKLGMGKFDRLMQRMITPSQKTEETKTTKQANKTNEEENKETMEKKEKKAAKKRAKRQRQKERKKNNV